MRLIPLSGKYATGHFTHAKVDDEDYAYLSKWRWKAKPNGRGTHIYAVRVELVDGVYQNVWMHRVVLGLSRDDPRDTDHRDHDTVNNRRCNLEPVSRAENQRRRRIVIADGNCARCERAFYLFVPIGSERRMYCSEECSSAASYEAGRHPFSTVYFRECAPCGRTFVARESDHRYCSDLCRNRQLRSDTSDAAGRSYYKRNRSKIIAASKQRYDLNKESILQRQRERRATRAISR